MARKKITNKFKDSDADGLTDAEEKKLGTDPKCADTDKDGVCDYEEIKVFGTDPLNPDTDGDGVKDGAEIKRGRNPKGPGFLKDLFIPHEGNDFQPKALHPYRLLFYALSSILLKVILIGAVIILPVEAWLTPDILVEQSRKIIALTNVVRQNLNLGLLTESPLLSQAAFNKAQDMIFKQYFAHTGPDNRSLADWLSGLKYNYAVAGENLAMGFSGPEEVVNGWSRSQTHYKNMIDPDFSEIGVGSVSGAYNNIDTTFVAQYFAAPAVLASQPEPALEVEISEPVKVKVQPAETPKQILGEKTQEPEEVLPKPAAVIAEVEEVIPPVVATSPEPLINAAKSKIYIDQPQGKKEKIVRAEVYLSPEAVRARVAFNNYFIDLKPGAEPSAAWTGQAVIFGQAEEQIFNPVVLASVTAEDRSGNSATEDLTWENITPAATTALEQYYFVKQHQPTYIKPLFDLTSIYYKIILTLAIAALTLNVLIQIRKQHPHIILSTVGLIGLLLALIIL